MGCQRPSPQTWFGPDFDLISTRFGADKGTSGPNRVKTLRAPHKGQSLNKWAPTPHCVARGPKTTQNRPITCGLRGLEHAEPRVCLLFTGFCTRWRVGVKPSFSGGKHCPLWRVGGSWWGEAFGGGRGPRGRSG